MDKQVVVQLKCPKCGKSLMDHETPLNDHPSVKLNLEGNHGRGTIRLCSIYGCYDHKVDIKLDENEVLKIFCPHCNQVLISGEKCEVCDGTMVPMHMKIGGKVAICSRVGCKQHYIAFEDVQTGLRKFYDTYGYM